jgi:hypothetical protein
VVYAAVVRRDIVGVEKDALLYCREVSIYTSSVLVTHTSLEAGHWCGHLYSARENVRKSGKDSGKDQSHCRSSSKEHQFVGHVQTNIIEALTP